MLSLPIIVNDVSFKVYYEDNTKGIFGIYVDVNEDIDLQHVLADDVLEAIIKLIKNWG